MRVIFARPGGLVLRFSGHGLCAFLPWDRASKPVVHNVTTALVPAQIWICMASSWQAECAFASEHTFPVGSILAASRGNSQAWLDPGNPGRTPTTRPGCGLPAWSSGCACLAVARWYGRAARASHSSGSRGVLPAPLALQRRCRAVRHRDLPGAWVQPRSHTTRTGRAPVASVCSWAPRSAAADAIVPRERGLGPSQPVGRWGLPRAGPSNGQPLSVTVVGAAPGACRAHHNC
jgi:hypothetical protein